MSLLPKIPAEWTVVAESRILQARVEYPVEARGAFLEWADSEGFTVRISGPTRWKDGRGKVTHRDAIIRRYLGEDE